MRSTLFFQTLKMAVGDQIEEERSDPDPDYEKNLARDVEGLVDFALECRECENKCDYQDASGIPSSPIENETAQEVEVSVVGDVENQLPDLKKGQDQSYPKEKLVGYMLVFNHWQYIKSNGITKRKHTQIDIINLEKAWTTLGYKVKFFINLTSEKILETIEKYLDHELTKVSSIVLTNDFEVCSEWFQFWRYFYEPRRPEPLHKYVG